MSVPMGCPTLGALVQGHSEERPLALRKYYQLCGQLRISRPQLWVMNALLGCPESWGQNLHCRLSGPQGSNLTDGYGPNEDYAWSCHTGHQEVPPLSLPEFRHEGMLFVFSGLDETDVAHGSITFSGSSPLCVQTKPPVWSTGVPECLLPPMRYCLEDVTSYFCGTS